MPNDSPLKKVLFIDRDGTLIHEPPETFQIDAFEKLKFVAGAITNLSKLTRETDFELVLVTNQDGLGTDAFPEKDFLGAHNLMLEILRGEGVEFAEIHIDRSFPHENRPTRKPGTAMLAKYFSGDYDLRNSFVIGDRLTDVLLARNLGAKMIFLKNYDSPDEMRGEIALITDSWSSIYQFLRRPPRIVRKHRVTKETDVLIELNLDGDGKSEISTGLHFFDHQLDQIARHGGIDLKIAAKGDLHVDEHHTIEDVGITLGEAFAEALQDKRGLARYGFCLPMDDALAQAAIDFGGRSWFVWQVEFKRERIGDVPTEMFSHFFKSLSDHAKMNLNLQATGDNEHHKIEAVFKAFARAVKMAIKREDSDALPTTKGSL